MNKILTTSLLLLMLTACSGSFEKIAPNHSWEAPPSENVVQQITPEYFETILKDSDSAKYRYGTPFKGYTNEGLLYGGKINWSGWLYPVSINAKNSYGGYTGFKTYYLQLSRGQIDGYMEKKSWDFAVNGGFAHIVY